MGIGDWGLGIGDWGLGIGPNPQSPNPNPQSPIPIMFILSIDLLKIKLNKFIIILNGAFSFFNIIIKHKLNLLFFIPFSFF